MTARQSIVVHAPQEQAFAVDLEAYAERTEQMRRILGSDDGWGSLLRRFGEAARAAS